MKKFNTLHLVRFLVLFVLLAQVLPVQAAAPSVVTPDPIVAAMLAQVTSTQVNEYDRMLAGELQVPVDGGSYTITTRQTYSGVPIQKTTRFVEQHMQVLGLDVENHVWGTTGTPTTYPNIIGEIPGLLQPEVIYIIGAHIDDVQNTPGADDNASGSVATLLAADILSQYEWGCTLRFAFWTGEEQGLHGSEAYAARARQNNEDIRGYLNLDMIAYNTKISTPGIDLLYNPNMPETQQMAQLFSDVVSAYSINLVPELLSDLSGGSDHMSFWNEGYRSILAIEDQDDFNPYYHQSGDTPANNDLTYFTNFVKASLATFVHDSNCLLPNGVGTVNGVVTDAASGTPIPGALVTIEDSLGRTSEAIASMDGTYTQGVPAGMIQLSASAFGYAISDPVSVDAVAGETAQVNFALTALPIYQVTGTVLDAPGGTPLEATVSVADAPIIANTDPLTGSYSLALPEGDYTLTAAAGCHQPIQTQITVNADLEQDFALPQLKPLLLVDDDQGVSLQTNYTTALDSLGKTYEVWTLASGGDPSLAKLNEYRSVLWFTGQPSSGTFTNSNEAAVAAYLDQGGSFFLSSHEYLYERGLTGFGQNYLGIASYDDDVSLSTIQGAAADPIGNGLGPYSLTTSYFGGTMWPDDVSGTQASPFKWTSNSHNNATRYDSGSFKTVFLAWPLETINNVAQRAQVLNAVINWFGSTCVLEPNTAPEVQDIALSAEEDIPYTFSAADFSAGFSDADNDLLQVVKILSLPENGSLRLGSVPVTVFQEIPAAGIPQLNFSTPPDWNGDASFEWNASDGMAYAAVSAQALITVAAVNDAPQVANPIPDQETTSLLLYAYTIPAATFSDVEADALTLTATLSDGVSLPAWLTFDGTALNGIPPVDAAGTWVIRIQADDAHGGLASDEFTLLVTSLLKAIHLPLITR